MRRSPRTKSPASRQGPADTSPVVIHICILMHMTAKRSMLSFNAGFRALFLLTFICSVVRSDCCLGSGKSSGMGIWPHFCRYNRAFTVDASFVLELTPVMVGPFSCVNGIVASFFYDNGADEQVS